MAVHPTDAAASGMVVHGLRFLNDEWNDSISNGDEFKVRWNQSLANVGTGLGVFKVMYPKDGVVVYKLVSNLTDAIDTHGDSCRWTPQSLEKKNLYAMWLTSGNSGHTNWTLSPPWIPKDTIGMKGTPWAAPFIIPIVCLLGLYAASLTGYLVYRRRKKNKCERDDDDESTVDQDSTRNNSVDSTFTVQTLGDIGDVHKTDRGTVPALSSTMVEVMASGAAGGVAGNWSDFESAYRSDMNYRGGIRMVTDSATESQVSVRSVERTDMAASVGRDDGPVYYLHDHRNFSRPVQTFYARDAA